MACVDFMLGVSTIYICSSKGDGFLFFLFLSFFFKIMNYFLHIDHAKFCGFHVWLKKDFLPRIEELVHT